MDKDRIQKFKFIIAIFIIVLVVAFVIFRIIKYQTEGEKNMPFNLSKIIVVSTAQKEDISQENGQNNIWNFNIIQTNDVYISIERNKNNTKKDEKIKNISINNIEVTESPAVGVLKPYMPNSLEGENYKYSDEYVVNDSLTYRASDKTDYKNLQIGQNGGSIAISFANKQVGTYSSADDTEITYDGTMLSKIGITNEQVKSKVAFDLIIELDEDTEEIIMDLIIENEELLKKKIKTNKISSKFAKKYIEINGIDNYFEEIEFDKSKETFSRAIYLIYDYFRNIGEIMDSLSDGLIKRIVVFYGENFDIYERKKEKTPEREQLLYRFMQMEIMKLLKDNKKINLLKSILKNNLKNKQIENELKFILKELMEEATNKSNIIEILTRKERKNKNIYFDKDKFLNDLLIIIKHLTELRLQIKLKGYKEDEINDLIRFGLEMKDYYVYDQRRGGESETRQNIGERDFAIKQNKIIVTILEALILRFIETENIKKHYDKLNSNYDTIGNRVNYFLCYYLGNNFNTFIERYKESSSILFNSDIEDLSSEYTEKSNIKIMKTKFKEKEIYHLLINFEN